MSVSILLRILPPYLIGELQRTEARSIMKRNDSGLTSATVYAPTSISGQMVGLKALSSTVIFAKDSLSL